MRTPGYVQQLGRLQQQPQAYPEELMQELSISSSSSSSSSSQSFDIRRFVAENRVNLTAYESIRKGFHSHPELSGQERNTASHVARILEKVGVPEIHTGIGGHGVAAVLKNGPGKTILLRSDSDALPVKEQTGLSYASNVTQIDTDGEEKPVMHACGHDVHITCLLGAAETLVKTRSAWSGTVIFVFQPAEERLSGASAMVEDGLYEKVPIPDILLGQHVFPDRAGTIGVRPGPFLAASDSMKITFFGRGAHASEPQNSVDPIVMAASAVLRLQTIVAREVAPLDTAVVTVSAIHGGEAENVIQSEAYIRVNVRTYTKAVRDIVLPAIKRIVEAEAQASGASKMPLIEPTHVGPATDNDPSKTEEISKTFTDLFGEQFDPNRPHVVGSEDFGILATAVDKPSVFWIFGGTDPEKFDDAKRRGRLREEIPSNHSPFFAPVMQPTLQVGIDGMVAAAMTFLGKK